jgi:plasmid stabilization system protein ParE
MKPYRFHPEARLEYIEALLHVEEEREGYGAKFEAEVDAALRRVSEFPRSAPRLPGFPKDVEARAFLLGVFRYSLLVVLGGDGPVIYAVAHQHRRPGYWKSRLK